MQRSKVSPIRLNAAARRNPQPQNPSKSFKIFQDPSKAKRRHRQKYSTRQIKEALEASHGLVHIAAARLKCHHSTIYRRMETDRKLRDVVRDLRGEIVDIAMEHMYQALLAGEMWAIVYTLRTFGKDRGYTMEPERQKEPNVKVVFHEE